MCAQQQHSSNSNYGNSSVDRDTNDAIIGPAAQRQCHSTFDTDDNALLTRNVNGS
eukprot:m.143858 g.143858  ORF g.143858 m.143858 type:complete len:55 (-) comp9667_c0_seq22:2424-2588(-)